MVVIKSRWLLCRGEAETSRDVGKRCDSLAQKSNHEAREDHQEGPTVRAGQKQVGMVARDTIASPRLMGNRNLRIETVSEVLARGQGYRIVGSIGMVFSALPLQKAKAGRCGT